VFFVKSFIASANLIIHGYIMPPGFRCVLYPRGLEIEEQPFILVFYPKICFGPQKFVHNTPNG